MNIEEEMEPQVFNGDAEELERIDQEILCLKYVYIDNIWVFSSGWEIPPFRKKERREQDEIYKMQGIGQ